MSIQSYVVFIPPTLQYLTKCGHLSQSWQKKKSKKTGLSKHFHWVNWLRTEHKTMSARFQVFVYGTLKKGQPNHHWLSQRENGFQTFLGKATSVNKFPLVIASRYGYQICYCNDIPRWPTSVKVQHSVSAGPAWNWTQHSWRSLRSWQQNVG